MVSEYAEERSDGITGLSEWPESGFGGLGEEEDGTT